MMIRDVYLDKTPASAHPQAPAAQVLRNRGLYNFSKTDPGFADHTDQLRDSTMTSTEAQIKPNWIIGQRLVHCVSLAETRYTSYA